MTPTVSHRVQALKRGLKAIRQVPRRMTAGSRVLPDFLIVGAQKAGTTTLFDHMVEQPAVLAPLRKEVHYFDLAFHRGVRYYKSFFPTSGAVEGVRDACGVAVTGEASPYYLFHPACAARAARVVPEAKIVVVLRDPVDRAFSHYHHEVRKGWETLSFDEAVAQEAARLARVPAELATDPRCQSQAHRSFSYLARGLYARQLQRWIDAFGREAVHVLTLEDLSRSPQDTVQRALQHVGVEAEARLCPRRSNAFSYPPLPPHLRASLRAYFAPHDRVLAELLGRDLPWDAPLS